MLQITYRECTEKIRPILAVAGKNFVHVPITEIFQQSNCKYSWIIYFRKMVCNKYGCTCLFSIYGYEKDLILKIEGGDLPGKSMRVSAMLLYKDKEIPLKTNRMQHKGNLSDEQYKALFSGIFQAFDDYKEKREDVIQCPELSKIKNMPWKEKMQRR